MQKCLTCNKETESKGEYPFCSYKCFKEFINNYDFLKNSNNYTIPENIELLDISINTLSKKCTSPIRYCNFIDYNINLLLYTSKKYDVFIQNRNEAIYLLSNNIEKLPTCKQCNKKLKFDKYRQAYMTYCSSKCALKSSETKEKRKQTCIKKYGVDNPVKSPEVYEKMKQTCIKKYGVDWSIKSPEVKEKAKQTCIKKYGVDCSLKSPKIQEKRKQTWIKKYGVDNIFKLPEVQEKAKQTRIERYGEDMFKAFHSKGEIELYSYCDSIFDFVIHGDRKLLDNGKELDIYIPQHNLAIEFNGLYWHSEDNKDMMYHIEKTEQCRQKGVRLLHIFEDEWYNKKDVIKSLIKRKAGLSTGPFVNVTDLDVVEVDEKTAKKYINKHHVLDFIPSTYYIGLKNNDDIMALMAIGSPLHKRNTDYQYEIRRYCINIDYTLKGNSADKILTYFIDKYSPTSILGRTDRRFGEGSVYEDSGFNKLYTDDPNFYYGKNGTKYSQRKFSKEKVKEICEDSYKPILPLHENLYKKGYKRIFDCGYHMYLWEK